MSALNSPEISKLWNTEKTSECYSTNTTDSLCSSCLTDYILVYLIILPDIITEMKNYLIYGFIVCS